MLVVDVLWVGSTHWTSAGPEDRVCKIWRWLLINVLASIAILVSIWTNLFSPNVALWRGPVAQNIALLTIVVIRTVVDYVLVWQFYYPERTSHARQAAPALPAGHHSN